MGESLSRTTTTEPAKTMPENPHKAPRLALLVNVNCVLVDVAIMFYILLFRCLIFLHCGCNSGVKGIIYS